MTPGCVLIGGHTRNFIQASAHHPAAHPTSPTPHERALSTLAPPQHSTHPQHAKTLLTLSYTL